MKRGFFTRLWMLTGKTQGRACRNRTAVRRSRRPIVSVRSSRCCDRTASRSARSRPTWAATCEVLALDTRRAGMAHHRTTGDQRHDRSTADVARGSGARACDVAGQAPRPAELGIFATRNWGKGRTSWNRPIGRGETHRSCLTVKRPGMSRPLCAIRLGVVAQRWSSGQSWPCCCI